MASTAVGIDLGTTYSCVAVYKNGKPVIIPNEEGSRITPSYVAFTNTERLIGSAAKNQDALNPTNTVFDAKRLIGRKFDDPIVQADIKVWPFEVINIQGSPKIKIQYKGQTKIFSPEQISSMVLGKMKEIAEVYLNNKVDKAVVTVPAYFNDSQRQATKDAGAIAGLKVLRIINEPTAAALAYGFGEACTDERNVLIYDLGGGTFDVSVLNIEEGVFEVKSTAGDTHLGGEDFDDNLVKYFLEEINRKHQKNLSNDKKALRRLRTACERAKRVLSQSTQASIDLEYLFEGKSFQSTITRARFEEMNMELFKETIKLIDEAIKEAKLTKNDIRDVVLVGGSTRIPMVRKLLSEYFNGKDLVQSVNPDEVVAEGAAIQAAILCEDSLDVSKILLTNVTPLSLGVNKSGGIMDVLVPRNTQVPTEKTKIYSTVFDSQPAVDIEVYEGEHTMTKDNNHLGKFSLKNIPPLPKGVPKIEVTFKLDADGILSVTAVETRSQKSKTINITNDKGRLSKDELNKMAKESEKYKKDDAEMKKKIELKNMLENYCISVKKKIEEPQVAQRIKHADKQNILRKIVSTRTWLDSNQNSSNDEFERRMKELKGFCDPFFKSN